MQFGTRDPSKALYSVWGTFDLAVVKAIMGSFSALSKLVLRKFCAKFTIVALAAVVNQIVKIHGPLVE